MKIIKNKSKDHKMSVQSDDGTHVLILLCDPKPCLWFGEKGDCKATFSDDAQILRELAKAILQATSKQ